MGGSSKGRILVEDIIQGHTTLQHVQTKYFYFAFENARKTNKNNTAHADRSKELETHHAHPTENKYRSLITARVCGVTGRSEPVS
jgi:hypothetical protein